MRTDVPLTVADADGRRIGQATGYTIDLEYGDSKNNFALQYCSIPLSAGMRVYIDGTAIGGVIDSVNVSVSDAKTDRIFKGRTWQGVLGYAVIEPPAGESHLTVSGNASDIIASLLEACGLGGCFAADPCGVEIGPYTFRRYIDLYSGLRMMLASAGARLSLRTVEGVPTLSAVDARSFGRMASERVSFAIDKTYRSVNKLIGLGKGEGANRAVSVWYADESNRVSQTQTLFGLDCISQTYQLTSEEAETLPEKTREKLEELQVKDDVSVDSIGIDEGLDVGDVIEFWVADSGTIAESEIVSVVYKASKGSESVDYRFGHPEWPEEED